MGFVDDVVLLTAASNQRELRTRVQNLATEQIEWARRHGAIFDVKKSKWVIFSHSEIEANLTITFGERTGLRPEKETRWLGVVLDSDLSFKRH